MAVVLLSLLLIFELIQFFGEFHVVFKHLQNLENLLLNILKEKTAYILLALLETIVSYLPLSVSHRKTGKSFPQRL